MPRKKVFETLPALSIRYVDGADPPLFVALDVARAMGHSRKNAGHAIEAWSGVRLQLRRGGIEWRLMTLDNVLEAAFRTRVLTGDQRTAFADAFVAAVTAALGAPV
jgi:prophage antirepressor-like protein